MAEILTLPPKQRKPYIPQQRGKAMTLALGIPCSDGVLLCADREITTGNHYKDSAEKLDLIEGRGWKIAFTYADEVGLAEEAKGKIISEVSKLEHEDSCPTIEEIYKIADETFTSLGRLWPQGVNLQALLGPQTVLEATRLIAFDGKGLYFSNKVECFGTADNALFRYLVKGVLSPSLTIECAKNVACYLAHQADKYACAVRRPFDIVVMPDNKPIEWLEELEVEKRIQIMEIREKKLLREIMSTA
jgi:20S proteasome alpha/beta subunit